MCLPQFWELLCSLAQYDVVHSFGTFLVSVLEINTSLRSTCINSPGKVAGSLSVIHWPPVQPSMPLLPGTTYSSLSPTLFLMAQSIGLSPSLPGISVTSNFISSCSAQPHKGSWVQSSVDHIGHISSKCTPSLASPKPSFLTQEHCETKLYDIMDFMSQSGHVQTWCFLKTFSCLFIN
jgi:hypothetical protein